MQAICTLPKKIKTVGVFASDQIPKRLALPAAIVVNNDTSDKPGSHWVSLFIDKKGNANYFDSYGRPPISQYIRDAIKRNCRKWQYNKKQFQSFDSRVCGEYCINFLYNMCKSNDFRSFLDQFSRNTRFNDKKTSKFYRQYIKNQLNQKINQYNTLPRGSSFGAGIGNQACTSKINYLTFST